MGTTEGFYQLDLPKVKSQFPDLVIRYLDQVDSTNDWARRVSANFTDNQSVLFLTRQQTSGRGRGDHRWDSSRGSLTFSILIPNAFSLKDPRRSFVALAAGCGVCLALEAFGAKPAVKWPNDIFCAYGKLGGILVESAENGSLVVGCGINVNNDVSAVKQGASLRDCCQKPLDLTMVLVASVREILQLTRTIESETEPLVGLFNRLDWLKGAEIQWSSGSQVQTGIACGITSDAALKIMTKSGELQVASGSVFKLN